MKCKPLLSTMIALLLSISPIISYATGVETTTKDKMPEKLFVPPVLPQLDKMHLNNSNAYALDMLRNFNQDAGNKNLVFSPTSLQFMIGMLDNAADEKTVININQAWHEPSSVTPAMINEQLALRLKFIEQSNNSATAKTSLQLANGLFISKKYQINPAYQKAIADYKAEISNIDFTNKKTVQIINDWVKKHTAGQIPKIIEGFQDPKTTAMVLTNAIAFQGQWPEKFFNVKNTKKLPFYGVQGKKLVHTMQQDHLKQYYEDDNLQATYLPYEGYQYALFIILPKSTEKDALDNLFNKLDITYFNTVVNGFFNNAPDSEYDGTLLLPRFKVTYSNSDLVNKSETLLGVNLAYNAATKTGATFNKALLQGNIEHNLVLNQMIHKAIIEVNEKGTKAAAATYAEISLTAMPMPKKKTSFSMKVDHPFIYGIMDNQQQLLFLGTIKSLPN